MRLLYWILGAAASAAAGALVLDRRSKRRLSDAFLAALRGNEIADLTYEAAIIAPGFRGELFRGRAAGRPFAFVARADASGTRWSYALVWGDAQLGASWNPLSGEADHPFAQAYVLLRRRVSKDDGRAN